MINGRTFEFPRLTSTIIMYISPIQFLLVILSIITSGVTFADSPLTPFLNRGLSIEAAVGAAIEEDPARSRLTVLGAAIDEGLPLDGVMTLSIQYSDSQLNAVATVAAAAYARDISPKRVLTAALAMGIPADVAASGISMGIATAGGNDVLQIPVVVAPVPNANAGQPINFINQSPAIEINLPSVPTPPANGGQPVSPSS